jgi:cytochrome c peroxidase
MDLSMDEAVHRINEIEGYRSQFQRVFGNEATRENLAEAIAGFLRTLLAGNSPYDRYRTGDLTALSPAARLGHDVFMFRANCQMCHRGPLLSDGEFHNLGVGMDAIEPDPGRAAVTEDMLFDTGAFRTPSLRDISRTAPYMHDGRFETLEEVLDFYEHAGDVNPHRMQMLNILVLTDEEKHAIVVFLKEGLTSDDYPEMEPPSLPQ